MSRKNILDISELRRLLCYDPETGHFIWLVNRSPKVRAGDVAGSRTGYVKITIDYTAYLGHRLAWFYMTEEWPSQIDHKDGNPNNNKFENLRLSTQSQNRANSRRSAKRILDLPKGVTYSRHHKKYRAQIYVRRKRILLGHFATVVGAAKAYADAADYYFGAFARTT